MNRFLMGPISFGSSTPTIVWQTSEVRVNPGIERLVQGAQSVDVAFAGAVRQVPMLTFDSPAIARMLGVIGWSGANIDQVDVYFRLLEHGGAVKAGEVHTRVRLYDTLSVLRRIRATQFQEATASFESIAVYDGTNLPLAIANNVALPAYTAAHIEKFTVGPAEFHGTDVDNVQSIEVDTGITEEIVGKDGDVYARLAAVRERQPSVTVNTFDASALSTIGVGGASKDNAIFFLRALTNKGAPASDSAPSHVKITAVDSHVTIEDMGDMTAINCQPVWDGSNDALSFETAQAIVTS